MLSDDMVPVLVVKNPGEKQERLFTKFGELADEIKREAWAMIDMEVYDTPISVSVRLMSREEVERREASGDAS